MALPTGFDSTDPFQEGYLEVTATTTPILIDLGKPFPVVTVINDGSVNVRVRTGKLPDSTYPVVKPAEAYTLVKPDNKLFKGRQYIGIVADSSTSAIRIYGLP